MRLPLASLISFVCLICGLAACGGGNDRGDGSFHLTIGDSLPLSGQLSTFGPAGDKAAHMALARIRAAIKADGLKQSVALQTEDDGGGSSGRQAAAAARKLVAHGASCIAGAWATPDTIRTAAVTVPDGALLISPASTTSDLTALDDSGLVARVPPADDLQGAALAKLVARSLGRPSTKTISVAGRDDSYGRELTRGFADQWRRAGGKLTAASPVLYPTTAKDYRSDAAHIVAGNPDAYLIADFPATFKKLAPALVETGKWSPTKTFVADGLVNGGPQQGSQRLTDGLRTVAPGTPNSGGPARAFGRLFATSAPRGVGRKTFDAQNFDAVTLCYLAAVAAGSDDGKQMAASLRDVSGPPGRKYDWRRLPEAVKALQAGHDIDYAGAAGPIDLDRNGDPTAGVYDALRFGEGSILPYGDQIAVGGNG